VNNTKYEKLCIGATHALDSCISHLTPPPPVICTWSRRRSFSFS